MYSIETTGLSHRFANGEPALNNVSLRVGEGSIYGFLGPNGAGKTTTLRLLLGLLTKQQGDIRIFGQNLESQRLAILRSVGSLIESPSVYSHLTATENLLVWQKVYRCNKSRIGEVLRLVDLADTGRKKAGQFSLGMKQRLGIAIALLHQPRLLILDEPTNGLDPHGMVEIRELLKNLNQQQGITILISSHLLSEIEKLVTDVGIISRGQILFEGSLAALVQHQQQASSVVIETDKPLQALQVLQAQDIEAYLDNERLILHQPNKALVAFANKTLVEQGVAVYGLASTQSDLESIFMNLTHH